MAAERGGSGVGAGVVTAIEDLEEIVTSGAEVGDGTDRGGGKGVTALDLAQEIAAAMEMVSVEIIEIDEATRLQPVVEGILLHTTMPNEGIHRQNTTQDEGIHR